MTQNIAWTQDNKIFPGSTSLDNVTDARSVALGEISIAAPYVLHSIPQNPATIINGQGLGLYYNFRSWDWDDDFTEDDFNIQSAGLVLQSRIGTFGIHYSRFDQGEAKVYLETDPDNIFKFRIYDQILSITYGRKIVRNISVGLNFKFFSVSEDYFFSEGEIKKASAADFGILYSFPGFTNHEMIKDKFYVGASIQNLGNDVKAQNRINDSYTHFELPRYLGIGLSYQVMSENNSNLIPLQTSFQAEFKKLLNPPRSIKSRSEYGGVGLEAVFYEILAIRMGGIYFPHDAIFGQQNRLSLRYGIGITLPEKLFGSANRWNLSLDLAHIPINDLSFIVDEIQNNFVFGINLCLKEFHL